MNFIVRKEKWGYILFNKLKRKYSFFNNKKELDDYLKSNQILKSETFFHNNLNENSNEVLSAPLAAYIEISAKCTLHCLHCFKSKNQIYSQILSVDRIKEIIEELYHMGVFEIRLVGYEACTNPCFDEIVDYIKGYGFYTVLNTSAYYSRAMQCKIVSKDFDEYLVSLDGMQETHDIIRGKGSYDCAISFVKMVNPRSKVRLNVTISRNNMEQMEELAQLASELQVSIGFTPFRNIGAGRENNQIRMLTAEDMRKIQYKVGVLRKKYPQTRIFLSYHDLCNDNDPYHPVALSLPCPSRHNISILNNGQVFHCDYLSYIGDKYCGGNLLESSVQEIWNGEFMKRYENVQMNQNCLKCKFYMKKCTGGCASEVLDKQNLFFDHLCTEYTNMRFKQGDTFYDEDYYQHGIHTGKSNYENYRWLPEYSNTQQKIISNFLHLSYNDVLVDFGAAMGHLMRAFNDNGYNMYGVDCSHYAVSKCGKYKEKLFCSDSLKILPIASANWVISINTLEHLNINQLLSFFEETRDVGAYLFYLVPISRYDGGKYISLTANKDYSHILRRSEAWWETMTKRYFNKVTIIPADELFGEYKYGHICVKATS